MQSTTDHVAGDVSTAAGDRPLGTQLRLCGTDQSACSVKLRSCRAASDSVLVKAHHEK